MCGYKQLVMVAEAVIWILNVSHPVSLEGAIIHI